MENEAEPTAASEPSSLAVTIYTWVLDHAPKSRKGRMAVAALIIGLVMIPSLALLFLPIWVDLSEDRFASFGYTGVFVANLASTATVFIPVPGLTAAGQALIISQGGIQNWVAIGLLGGTGMALGEVTAYAAGAAGSQVAKEGEIQAPRLVRPLVERLVRWVNWMMARYGFVTLLVLSAIPNPAFELAGITAGVVRMNFWRFLASVLIGKNIRGLALAYAGARGFDIPFLT